MKKKIIISGSILFLFIVLVVGGYFYFKPHALYKKAEKLVINKKYLEAMDVYSELNDFKDSNNLKLDANYLYGIDLLDTKKYSDSLKVFKLLDDYKDSKSMYLKSKLEYANDLTNHGNYKKALILYNELGDYPESISRSLDAKFLYVSDNKDRYDEGTMSYLLELVENDYPGSADIYSELTVWTVDIIQNDLPNDPKTIVNDIDREGLYFFHVVLRGGKPGEVIKLRFNFECPHRVDDPFVWEKDWTDGTYGRAYGMNLPGYQLAEIKTVYIYNDITNELLGTASINLK